MTTNRNIDETAARWHARTLLGALSAADEQRLDAWLDADPRHRLAYADVAATGYALEQAAPHAPRVSIARAPRWPAWFGAALAPAALIAVLLLPHAWQDWHSDAHTAVGAVASQHLVDGSTLQLDTDSAVALPFAADKRDIELLRGDLAVDVAKDPQHPFRVHCVGVEARAVGTKFVVARHAGNVEVGVIEGVVAVSPADGVEPTLITAGQRAFVDTDKRSLRSEALPAASYGWTRGVLSFERVPLRDVVAEIGRYLPEHVSFRAAGHADTPVTATFPLDRPDAALGAVAKTNGLTLRHVPNVLYTVED